MGKKKTVRRLLTVILILLLILLVTAGCGFAYLYFHGMSGLSSTSEPAPGQIRVACVGDSITYGHGTTGWPGNTYPAVLQRLLGQQYHVNNYGASGYAVQDTADRPYTTLAQYPQSLAYEADIVVFMMGSNDTKPINWIDEESYREALLHLLDSYADARILLCTVPAAFFLDGQTEGVTNHNIQPLVAGQIAQVIREVAAERGYPLVDIYALTAQHPEWFAKDGVHPNNDGAAAIAQAVYSALTEPEMTP